MGGMLDYFLSFVRVLIADFTAMCRPSFSNLIPSQPQNDGRNWQISIFRSFVIVDISEKCENSPVN